MKRLLALVFALAALAVGRAAEAACGTLPYVFTDNVSTVSASTTNANNNFLYACATQVDNSQIGTAGIFPAQIIPNSTLNGTFSGTFPFTFSLATASQVPLTVVGYTSQSADLFDIYSASRATKYVWVDSSGVLHANASPVYSTPLAIASGGTGSSTQNFVDLSTTQSVGGAKTFTTALTDSAGGAWLTGNGGGTGAIYQTTQNSSGNLYSGIESSAGGTIFTGTSAYAGVFGTSSSYALQLATNNTVRETISAGGATSFTGSLSAVGLTSTAGVAAGGAITGATTGGFSGQVTASSFSTTSGATVYNNSAISGTFGAFSITGATSSYVRLYLGSSATNFGVLDLDNTAGNVIELFGGGTAVSGVTGTELNVDRLGGSTYLAIDGSGNMGLLGTLKLGTALGVAYGGTGSATQNFVDLTTNQTIAGTKTFSTPIAIGSGGTGSATQNFVDLTTGQTVAGVKTFSSAPVSSNGFTAGSSSYGATSASVNGTIQGSSSGTSTTTYHPPMYAQGTTAIANTAHSVFVPAVTTGSSLGSGCPPHGTWSTFYCTSFTISPAFTNTGISATSTAGNTMPTYLCGPQWGFQVTHVFSASLSLPNYGLEMLVDDTQPNTVYIAETNVGSLQVGPFICTGY